MSADELIQELEDLADSLDDHVTIEDVFHALRDLRDRVKREGIARGGTDEG